MSGKKLKQMIEYIGSRIRRLEEEIRLLKSLREIMEDRVRGLSAEPSGKEVPAIGGGVEEVSERRGGVVLRRRATKSLRGGTEGEGHNGSGRIQVCVQEAERREGGGGEEEGGGESLRTCPLPPPTFLGGS